MLKKSTKSFSLLFLLVFTLGFFLPLKDVSAQGKVIGQISEMTGDVLVRSDMIWQTVEKAPFPVHSGDKVVTQRGRAVVTFLDTSSVTLGLDTNIKIRETAVKETKGKLKRKMFARTIELPLGSVWYKVQKNPAVSNSLKTPTMAAAILGSELFAEVNPRGLTQSKRISGNIRFGGKFSPPRRNVFKPPVKNVSKKDLPKRNAKVANTPLQKEAEKAVKIEKKAKQAAQKAQKEVEKAKKMLRSATTSEDKLKAKKELAKAKGDEAKAQTEQAKAMTQLAKESVSHAVAMKETKEVNSAGKKLEKANKQEKKIAKEVQEIEKLVKKASNAKTENEVDKIVKAVEKQVKKVIIERKVIRKQPVAPLVPEVVPEKKLLLSPPPAKSLSPGS